MKDDQQVIFGAIISFFSLCLFLFLIANLYRFLRFVWTRLPTHALSFQGADLDKLVATCIALIFVPSIATYAWTTAKSLFKFVAELIGRLSGLDLNVKAICSHDLISCSVSGITSFLGETASNLVRVLNFEAFQIVDFVLFILLAVVIAQVINLLRYGFATGGVTKWVQITNEWVPKEAREIIMFAGFVAFAFYLGLSALLAIPLFQDKSRSQNLTVDALDKAMEPNVIKVAEFDKIFPENLPAIREIGVPVIEPKIEQGLVVQHGAEMFSRTKTILQSESSELQNNWSSLRQLALSDHIRLREQAKSAFASGLEVGIGRKQTAQHYYDLFLWHQSETLKLKNGLLDCLLRASSFNNFAGQTLEEIRSRLQGAPDQDELRKVIDDLQLGSTRTNIFSGIDSARNACHPVSDYERVDIPRRRSFVESLGAVGNWSGWLLVTEQMPVVIIVGLVGFSLLGATVSRAIRARQADPNGPSTRLSLDDLAIVIAVGTTSAVVVFLAAYGGLAVLGGSSGDPNPYVLFATCLIGAVYSEDVWNWARTKSTLRVQDAPQAADIRAGTGAAQDATPAANPQKAKE